MLSTCAASRRRTARPCACGRAITKAWSRWKPPPPCADRKPFRSSRLFHRNDMPATIIDSRIFGDIFSSQAMRAVWSDETRTAKYVEIERALAIVQGQLGIIPQEAADEIVRNCDVRKIDLDKLRVQTERIGYPILGVVSQLNALCRDKLGEYVHWSATTQDITATATVLQIRDGLGLITACLSAIRAALAALAPQFR